MLNREEGGRFFREVWIAGVHRHFPGTPKPSYLAPWESMPDWEKEIVTEIYAQMQALIQVAVPGSDMQASLKDGLEGGTLLPRDARWCLECDRPMLTHLEREQGGRVIRLAWIGQVYKHFTHPKSAYICNWEEMPSWEQEVYIDIFGSVQAKLLDEFLDSLIFDCGC